MHAFRLPLLTSLLCISLASHVLGADEPTTAPAPRTAFINGFDWPDADGAHINAHGGGLLFHEGVYYWYGEDRSPRGRGTPSSRGVSVYTSTDLYNWKRAGLALPVVEDNADSDIATGCTIERPKVVYNAQTKKFVMWFHLELKGKGYGAARSGLALSDTPTGPFTFVRSLRPNANRWPIDMPEALRSPLARDVAGGMLSDRRDGRKNLVEGAYARRDFASGQMARDMTLYVDDDGKAYLIASAEENYTLGLHELTDDYTDFTGKWMRVAPGGHNEAPALIKDNGTYYMLASGCTGWAPNDARVITATNIWGPWKQTANPCTGINPVTELGANKTYGGQSTFILPVPGKPKGSYIAMFDVWRPRALNTSGHIWLPMKIVDGKMKIQWRDTWELGAFK